MKSAIGSYFTKLPKKPWSVAKGIHFNYDNWLLKRSLTTKIFVLECVMLGMEYSVTFLTLWLYLKTLVHTDYPKVFYSLVSASYLLACVVFSVVIGRIVDRTRQVRLTFITCNTLVIIGNIIYALHFSPWLLVMGRLISGTDGPLRSIISGEVARSFPTSEVLSKFSIMGMAFALGFIMGPGVNFLFTSVDFWIGSWHITYVNVPGLYMAFFFFVTQITVIFGLSDLSREFDLKKESIEGKYRESKVKVTHFDINKSNVPKKFPRGVGALERSLTQRNDLSTSVTYGGLDDSVPFMKLNNSTTYFENSYQTSYQTSANFPDNSVERSLIQSKTRSETQTSIENTQTKTEQKTIETSTQRRKRMLAYEKLEQSTLFSQSFGVSDCLVTASMLYFLRSQQSKASEEESEPLKEEELCNSDEMSSVSAILKLVVKNVDAMLVMIFTLTLWYWMVAFDMWLPILVVDVLKFGITELNGIVFGFGIFSAVILFIISSRTFTDKTLLKLAMVSMVALALMEGIFIIFRTVKVPLAVNAIMWIIWGTLFAIVVVMDEVFLVGVLAKMVHSSVQTFTESIRLAMSRLGALIALLTSALLFDWLVYVCTAAIVFSIISLVLLLWRRKTLGSPSVCIK